jgi:thioredoxin 1
MKKLIAITCVFSMIFMIGAKTNSSKSGKGVSFTQTSLANAIHLAQAQKKLIFIDIYAIWCGPCVMLKLRTFSNKDAGQFFNENFINLSLDGEKGEGLKLFQAYQLTAFPTLIILDSDGTPLLGTAGYMDAKTLIEFGQAGIEKSKK